MTFIDHDEEIFREEVKKGVRWLSFTPAIHVTRVVFDPISVAHFPQHFNIVLGPLFQALGFYELAFLFKDLQLLL